MFQMVNSFQFSFEGCLILLALVAPLFFIDKLSSKSKSSRKILSK